MMDRRFIGILCALLVFIVAGLFFLSSGRRPEVVKFEPEVVLPDTYEDFSEMENTTGSAVDDIWIHISGAVVHPGVYCLSEGARVFEAVDLAGGMTEDADADSFNLAHLLQDGQHIYIPDRSEAEMNISGEDTQPQDAYVEDGKVDINTASADELMKLPGIGASKAQAIIDHREHSPFMTIEDIMNVSGIKESSFNKIKDKIKV